MSVPLKFSDAFAIGLHATAIIAASEEKTSVATIAKELQCSLNHLQKVLQRLSKSNILDSVRGPRGGFRLAKKAEEIKVVNIYEAIEGTLELNNCLFEKRTCTRSLCVLGGLTTRINNDIKQYFSNTTIRDLVIN